MSKRIGNIVIIETTEPQQCDDCGEIEEVQPYGPNYSLVCPDCGDKDKEGTWRRMMKVLFDDDNPDWDAFVLDRLRQGRGPGIKD